MAVLFRRWDGVYEPLVCCDDGVCTADGCEAMIPDGAEIAFPSGDKDHVSATSDASCASMDAKRVLFTGTGTAPSSEGLAVWPTTALERFWWRGSVTFAFPGPLAPGERAHLLRMGAKQVDEEYAEIDPSMLDLDDDGIDEKVLAIGGLGGGVFTEHDDDVRTLNRLTTNVDREFPEVTAAADLNGDGGLEIVVLGFDASARQLLVIDAEHGKTLLHSQYECRERPVHELDERDYFLGHQD